MKRLLPYLLILPLFTGCSALSAFLPSFGDGPSVDANAQIGKENTQQIVGSQTEAGGEAQVADQANQWMALRSSMRGCRSGFGLL